MTESTTITLSLSLPADQVATLNLLAEATGTTVDTLVRLAVAQMRLSRSDAAAVRALVVGP